MLLWLHLLHTPSCERERLPQPLRDAKPGTDHKSLSMSPTEHPIGVGSVMDTGLWSSALCRTQGAVCKELGLGWSPVSQLVLAVTLGHRKRNTELESHRRSLRMGWAGPGGLI